MAEGMAKNAVSMMNTQKKMSMQQRQLMMATQIAMGRERFRYMCYLYGLAYAGLPLIALKTKNPKMMFPLVPMGIFMAYNYDMLYGNMQIRI